MSELAKLEGDFAYWQGCYKRCGDDLSDQMMIAEKLKEIRREYHKLKDKNNKYKFLSQT